MAKNPRKKTQIKTSKVKWGQWSVSISLPLSSSSTRFHFSVGSCHVFLLRCFPFFRNLLWCAFIAKRLKMNPGLFEYCSSFHRPRCISLTAHLMSNFERLVPILLFFLCFCHRFCKCCHRKDFLTLWLSDYLVDMGNHTDRPIQCKDVKQNKQRYCCPSRRLPLLHG